LIHCLGRANRTSAGTRWGGAGDAFDSAGSAFN